MIASTSRAAFWGMTALAFAGIATLACPLTCAAEDKPEPILRIDTGGHSSYVTTLAWHPSGRQLWSAGWDKIVRVWQADDSGTFVGKPDESIRLPIGPGSSGKIDAIACSSDGRWLAIGGYSSLVKRAASFRDSGADTAISSVELLEQGVIYVLDRSDNSFRLLEGHRGPVSRLNFVPAANGTEQLISAGLDVDAKQETVGSIRIWDVATSLQVKGILLPEPKNRPSFALLNPSRSSAGDQVLATWGAGKLYHWTPSKPPQFRTYPDGLYNNLIAAGPGSQWVVTASADNATNEGRLTFWNLDAAGLPVRDDRRLVRFTQQGNEIFLPLGMTLMASRPNGEADLLAVALCVFRLDSKGNALPDRFQLRVITIPNNAGASREIVRKELWKSESPNPRVPDLAATASGHFLAIAGNPNHEILVYRISDLLQGQTQVQRLSGKTATLERIEFVDRQGELGLRMLEKSVETSAVPATSVFDFSGNRLDVADAAAWKVSQPSVPGWSVARAREDPLRLDVLRQGAIRQTVHIPRRHSISGFALTAPLDRTQTPLLVVAAHEDGQPWLGVFDVKDGGLKRVFHAHTEPIISLAMSGDSRLFATASSDQTIAVWDISDIHIILQPRSTLAGVALLQKAQAVEVEQVQAPASASLPLKAGDQLLGFLDPTRNNVFRPWRTIDELNASLWEQAAGAKITLRRKRGPDVADVAVALQQAADERKPLFQLMITRPNDHGVRQWIGWSPLGPFDASDREIKQHLGWHFNLQKPGTPIAFAPLDQYPDLFRSGLLGELVKNFGLIAPIPANIIEPRMSLKLLVPTVDRWNPQQVAVIRQVPESIMLGINNPEFSAELIKTIRLKVDGVPAGSFSPSGPNQWQIDSLQLASWTRGEHRLQAELETRQTPARTLPVELRLDYVPLSPTIDPTEGPPSLTKDARVTITTTVKPSQPNLPFDVKLNRLSEGAARETVRNWKSADPTAAEVKVEATLDLKEGKNVFVLEAQNRGASEATRELEQAALRFEIIRAPRDKNPPTIELVSVERIDGSVTERIPYSPQTPLLIQSESIRLSGTIRAQEKLTQATVAGAGMPGFVANTTAEYKFQIPVQLKPGRNSIRLSAKTDVSPETLLELIAEFRQPLPEVEIVQPLAEQVVETLLSRPVVRLQALFEANPRLRPIGARAIINGQLIEQPLSVDLQAGTIQGDIPLALGTNTLQLQLSNDTRAQTQSRPVVIYYQPTPVVSDRQVPMEIDGAAFEMRLSGSSASPIHRVLLDGRELPPSQWQSQQEGPKFDLQIHSVPWQSDRQKMQLAIFAAGVDKPAFETVNLPKRKLPAMPPNVVFLSPSDNATVASEFVTLEYEVRSRTAITKLELLHDGVLISQPRLEPVKEGEDASVRQQVVVQLRAEPNTFQLVAENKDGMRTRQLTLNYLPSPVVLQLDSMAPVDSPDARQPLVLSATGAWSLKAPVERSRHVLSGRVKWNYRDDNKLQDPRLQVWVAVNGFKQPIRLAPPVADALERVFTCQVQLFLPQGNVVEVSAPDLPELASARAIAKVDCKSPELPRQRLHLVIIGVGVKQAEEASLMKEAVALLSGTELRGVESRKEFVFKSPAFAESVGYGPFTGPVVSRERISTLLEMVRIKIQQSQARDPANDVMLVYYRGGEQVYENRQYYLTTRETQSERDAEMLRNPIQLQYFAVSSDELSKFVDRCPGTHLLLLDVARTLIGKNVAGQTPDFIPGAATFRYAWLKGPTVPTEARLISAWQSAPQASRLAQFEKNLATQHARIAQRYGNAVSYENHLPEVLRGLTIGAAQ